MRWRLLPVLALLTLATTLAGAEGEVPTYALPEGFAAPPASGFDDAPTLVADAVRSLLDRAPVWERRRSRRTLAAVGPAALPAIATALSAADRRGRRDLVVAVSDIDGEAAVGLLVAAAGDPAWAVREQAILGLSLRDEAAAVLVSGLEDPVWRVRRAAVEGLRRRVELAGDGTPSEVRAHLAGRLDDPDREVRRTAARALLRLDDVEHVGRTMGILLDGPKKVRLLGLRELPIVDDPGVLTVLGGALLHPDLEVALVAAERFACIRGAAVLENETIRNLLRQELLYPRESLELAVAVLRRVGPDALSFLEETLSRRGRSIRRPLPGQHEPPVRRLLELMASIGGERSVPIFRRIVEESSDVFLVRHAVEVGRLTFPRALEESFHRRFLDERDVIYALQARLLVALASSAPERAAPLLLEAAGSGTFDLQMAVLTAITALGDRCDREALLTRIIETSRNARVLELAYPFAIAHLAEKGVALVRPGLRDRDLRVRARAAKALANPTDPTVAAELRAAFREAAPTEEDDHETLGRKLNLRRELLGALPREAGEADVTLLAEALRAPEIAVRETAALVLMERPSERTAEALLAALETEAEDLVRKAIIKALTRCDSGPARERVGTLVADGTRADRLHALVALETGEGPLPDAVREGLLAVEWDANLRAAAAAALARRGGPGDIERLVDLLAKGAPPEVEDAILSSFGERDALAPLPKLVALLPTGPLEEVDPGRHEFLLVLVECLGRIRDPRATEALRDLLRRAALPGEPAAKDEAPFHVHLLATAAEAYARIDPETALPDLLDLVLDPDLAAALWERGATELLEPLDAVCGGLQRVAAIPLAKAVEGALEDRRRSGRLLAIPPRHLAYVADRLKDATRKRPRRRAATHVRAALLSLPPRLSAWALEAADDQTRRYAFRGTVEQSLASVRRVRWLLAADPERPVTSVLPSGIRRGGTSAARTRFSPAGAIPGRSGSAPRSTRRSSASPGPPRSRISRSAETRSRRQSTSTDPPPTSPTTCRGAASSAACPSRTSSPGSIGPPRSPPTSPSATATTSSTSSATPFTGPVSRSGRRCSSVARTRRLAVSSRPSRRITWRPCSWRSTGCARRRGSS
jgi:HEAT repeat protein